MPSEEEKLLTLREEMVARQLRGRGIHHEGVLAAFLAVPRELFLPSQRRPEAYGDHPIPIGQGQTISQPYVTALMLQELDPRGEHRVLDVGAGSGYQTAILARLVHHVYAIERIEALTEQAMTVLAALNVANVTLWTGDGSLGYPEEAPFDRIICGAAAPEVPQPWIDQLADNGRIVMPVGGQETQTVVILEKDGSKIRRREICGVRFVKLIGHRGWPE
ncbi:MAG: protein-L-isoaspartate(D-aspartate) O-methyltransferase [Phycisphaerae bacterium]|nr:protein-L-isoaspartate(D-aspartate) O-methyltransferase [Phycisphaerae bacterium]